MEKQGNGKKLLEAILDKDTKTIAALLNKGVDFSVEDKGDKAVHLAARSGMLDTLKLMSEKGADLNAPNVNKNRPIHYAARFGYLSLIDFLIQKGADRNAQNAEGDTPLHFAVTSQPMDVIEELVKKGMSVNKTNMNGDTPLHTAVQFSRQEAMEALLLLRGSVEAKNKKGETPLDLAKNPSIASQLRIYKAMTKAVVAGYIQAKGMKFDHTFVETARKIDRVGIILESMDLEKNCLIGFYCRREKSENSTVTLPTETDEEVFSDVFHIRTSDYARNCRACVKLPLYMPPSEKDEMILRFIDGTGKDTIVDGFETQGKFTYMTLDIVLVPATTVICVVFVRPRVEEKTVGQEGDLIKSEIDKDFTLDVPAGTFDKGTLITLKVYDTQDKEEGYLTEEDEESEDLSGTSKASKTKTQKKQTKQNVKKNAKPKGESPEKPSQEKEPKPQKIKPADDSSGELLKTDVYQINIQGDQPKKGVAVQMPLKEEFENEDDICIIRGDENDLDRENALEIVPVKPKVINFNLVFEVSHFCIYTATSRKKVNTAKEMSLLQETIANTRARKKRAKFFVVLKEDTAPKHTLIVECNSRNMTKHRLKRWTKVDYELQTPEVSDEVMLAVGDEFYVDIEGNATFDTGVDPQKGNKIVFSNGRESFQAYPVLLEDKHKEPEATVLIKWNKQSSSTNLGRGSRDDVSGVGDDPNTLLKLPIRLHVPKWEQPSVQEAHRYKPGALPKIEI